MTDMAAVEVMKHGKLRQCKLLKCDACKEDFYRDIWHISPIKNFCSVKCTRRGQNTIKSVNCFVCKKPLLRPLYQFKKHKIFYCNQKCRKNNIKIYTPRQKILRRKEIGVLNRMFGTALVPIEFRKLSALMQIQRKKFNKNVLTSIRKGKTYEAYI